MATDGFVPQLVYRALIEQRDRYTDLYIRLADKENEKLHYNAKLQKTRRRPLKQNGLGRPARKFKEPSREDEARRHQYIGAISVIGFVLSFQETLSPDRLAFSLRVLEVFDEAYPADPGNRAVKRHRRKTIASLRSRFCATARAGAAATEPRPWEEKLVREDIARSIELQKLLIAHVTQYGEYLGLPSLFYDRVHARLDVLERFRWASQLSEREQFLRTASIVRAEPKFLKSHRAPLRYRQAWAEAVESFVRDISARFGPGVEPGSDKARDPRDRATESEIR